MDPEVETREELVEALVRMYRRLRTTMTEEDALKVVLRRALP